MMMMKPREKVGTVDVNIYFRIIFFFYCFNWVLGADPNPLLSL